MEDSDIADKLEIGWGQLIWDQVHLSVPEK